MTRYSITTQARSSSSSCFPQASHRLLPRRHDSGHPCFQSPQQRSQRGVICWVVCFEQPSPTSVCAWAYANKVSGSNCMHQQTSLPQWPSLHGFSQIEQINMISLIAHPVRISPGSSEPYLWPLTATQACIWWKAFVCSCDKIVTPLCLIGLFA